MHFEDNETLEAARARNIRDALQEDIGRCDWTAELVPADRRVQARVVAKEDGVDEVLLFVVDILKEEATLLVPNDTVKTVAEKSFGAKVDGDQVVLPGIMSRKKQIIPALTM